MKIAAVTLVLALAIASSRASAEIPPPSPTPSFSLSATATFGPALGLPIAGPGCPATASWSILSSPLPDGSYYVHISQVNILSPASTPCPGTTPVPTPSPSPEPTPTPTPVPTVTRVEDEVLTYTGLWDLFPPSASFPKSGRGDHSSKAVGATYGMIFTGTQINLIATYAPHHGIGSLRIDDGPLVDVDFYAFVRADQAVVWRSGPLGPGVHRLVMTVTGRKNPSSTDTYISIDAIDITDGALIPPLSP